MALPSEPITLATDGRDLWDRQPNEGQKPYDQFVVFRDLGRTRHWKKVAERFNLRLSTAQQYSRVYRWPERAHAFDSWMDKQWVAALQENSRRMAREHIKLSRRVFGKLEARIETLDPDTLSPTDFVRMAELYSKLSRVAVGEPDTHVAVTGHAGHPPIAVTNVPGDEATRQEQMREAAIELARRLAVGSPIDAEDILNLEI